MSSMDIDKPLDEIIASKPRARRGGRAPRGGARGGAAADGAAAGGAGGARARYAGNAPSSKGARAPAPAAPAAIESNKIIISNLPADVNEAAIRDLMQSTIGPTKSVLMAYTATGKSTGVSTVIFRNKGDAQKAHAKMIDNQRPMKVEIAIDPNAVQSLAARVAAPANSGGKGGRGQQSTRGARGAARQPRAPRAPRPAKKTAEDLDAEMAAYKSTTAA